MDFKEIVSVSGKPGLGLVVGKRPTGFIVQTIDEAKKRYPTSLSSKVSFLADISMYTLGDDVKLSTVLANLDKKVKEEGLELITKKDSADSISNFFKQILPDYDAERVYNSDIIKLVAWYKILENKLDFQSLDSEGDDSEEGKKSESIKVSNKPNAAVINKVSKSSSSAKGGNKKAGNIKAG
jgi:hypothetical protein